MFEHIFIHPLNKAMKMGWDNRKTIIKALQEASQAGSVQEAFQAVNKVAQEASQAAEQREKDKYKYSCPSCGKAPPIGTLLQCNACNKTYSAFTSDYMCPHCGKQYCSIRCLSCGEQFPIDQWAVHPNAGTTVESVPCPHCKTTLTGTWISGVNYQCSKCNGVFIFETESTDTANKQANVLQEGELLQRPKDTTKRRDEQEKESS